MIRGDRLGGHDVEAGAGDAAGPKGPGQGRLVHQPAARGVDDERALLHGSELRRPDQVAGCRRQRAVQGDDVALGDDGLEGRVERAHAVDALIGGEAHLHAESLRSEEHTSELQSLMRISYAVFCLKKKNITTHTTTSKSDE